MTHRFGTFEFDVSAGELRKQGRLVRLEPQPARALALLLSRAGELVTRDDLRSHLWGDDTHVEFDRGLAYCIGQVRTALGDTADNPRFVQTLPKRGYRFIAPVQGGPPLPPPVTPLAEAAMAANGEADPTPTRSRASAAIRPRWIVASATAIAAAALVWTGWARVARPRPVVAVAVFDNETGAADLDKIAATAADVVVERLTALGPHAIGVIGNTPVLRVARAARDPVAIRRETGAGYLVLGQVQNDEAGVRMVVHLIRLDDDTHLWVTRVVRPAHDLGNIEDVAADRLAEAVRRHLIARDPDAPRFTR